MKSIPVTTVRSTDLDKSITYKRKSVRITVHIKFNAENQRLSISGSVYEPNRYDRWEMVGGGQCYDQLIADFPRHKQAMRLVQIWKRWHLNDMNAGCEHQQKMGWTSNKVGEPCPTCGYKYGTAWLFEQVPAEIIDELEAMA